jgi:hypothetical protein
VLGYLRAHRAAPGIAVVLGGYLIVGMLPRFSVASPLSPDISTASLAFPPLIVAVVAVAIADSRHLEAEWSSARRWVRSGGAFLFAGACLVGSAAAIALGTLSPAREFGADAGVRNLLALAGLASISAAVVGVRLAWATPVIAMAYSSLAIDPRGDPSGTWSVLMQPDGHAGASYTAAFLFACGLAASVAWSRGRALFGREGG